MGILHRLNFMKDAWGASKQATLESQTFLEGILQRGQPPTRGTKELLQAYSRMPWLRAVANKISISVASTVWTVSVQQQGQQVMRNQKLQRAGSDLRQRMTKQLKQAGELREIEDHPLLDLLNNANPEMTGRMARQVTQIYLDLKGETFWLIIRNGAGMPVEFFPLPPHWVLDVPSADKPFFRISVDQFQQDVPESEVIWLKDPDPLNPFGRGVGIAESLADELETDEYAAKHTKSWFFNRAVPDILVGVEGASEEQLKAAQQRWEDQHRGFKRSFRSNWHAGNIKVEQLSQTFADQQLKDLREFERNTIIQVFGVPPEILGVIENSNRATIESADFLFSRWVVLPRLEFLRTEMQEKLVPQFDERLILDFESPVQEDKEHILNVASAAPWALTRNEWRDLIGLEPDERQGDFFLVPLNLLPERADAAPMGPPTVAEPEPQPETEEMPEEEPEAVEEIQEQRTVRKQVTEQDVTTLLTGLRPEFLTEELDPVFLSLIETFAIEVLEDLGVDIKFNILNPLINDHLQAKTFRIMNLINPETESVLRANLIEGVQAGEGIPQLADRVSQTFDQAKGFRSVRIARTEVLSSSNFATWQAHIQSGVVQKRQWLTARDDRVRDEDVASHEFLDGQIQPINLPFIDQNGATALHPGGFGVAAEDINCRCTTIPIIEDPRERSVKQRLTGETLRRLFIQNDRRRQRFEHRVLSAAKKGFQAQQNEVMSLLNNLR